MNVLMFLLLLLIGIQINDDVLAENNIQEIQARIEATSVPQGKFTPFGYLDNPHHSMVFNRSGVIRSFPPLGFGYWKKQFFGSYGEGPRGHLNYISLLQMSLMIDKHPLVTAEDFRKKKIDLYSAYHTKNMMSYDGEFQGVRWSFQYFLPRENSLVCRVEFENSGKTEKTLTLHATHIYGDWEIKWWGSNGLSAEYVKEKDVTVSKIWAYGDVFVLSSDWPSAGYQATGSQDQWQEWVTGQNPGNVESTIVKGPGPLYAVQTYHFKLPGKSKKSGMIYLCRGKNQEWVLAELDSARQESYSALEKKLEEDDRFWKNCPRLEGDWPESWKHGWVYDWETLRMNIRTPVGIFKHPWDAMQVHSPRLVLGETALDMMTYSYADPRLAKEVIYGTFADALAPNVPCAREDGSVNMIGADGSECGTAPMWGFPFHVIESIYQLTADSVWIRQLYPYLKAYLEWWLVNRTDSDGWLHCNNSWESGQDGSRRFLVEGEGDPATFVRTVDVEASMAEAMIMMQKYAAVAGQTTDIGYWQQLAERRVTNTRSMFADGWFRDIDGRNNQPILFEDFYDPIMLAPLTCNIATDEQVKAIRPKFQYFVENSQWLQWPPAIMALTEAAWVADEQLAAATALAQIARRVYARTDSRELMFASPDDPFSYRIPGIANEFWPVKDRPAGGENYGWGAILPAFLIRTIMGYREFTGSDENMFILAPAIPVSLWQSGNELTVKNLHFRNLTFDITYRMKGKNELTVQLKWKSPDPIQLKVMDRDQKILWRRSGAVNTIRFSSRNDQRHLIKIENISVKQ